MLHIAARVLTYIGCPASHVQVPSEMVINEKWDACLERTVINFGIGVVVGGLGSLVVTRKDILFELSLMFYPATSYCCI